jgi:hypothetical protein
MGEGVDLGSQSVAGATFSSGFLHALAVAGSAVTVFPAKACLIRYSLHLFAVAGGAGQTGTMKRETAVPAKYQGRSVKNGSEIQHQASAGTRVLL